MVRQADLYAVSLPISQLIKERVEQGTEGSKGRREKRGIAPWSPLPRPHDLAKAQGGNGFCC